MNECDTYSVCDAGYFFFFKQKTAYEMRISDWSSDVCSSDLPWPDARDKGGTRQDEASPPPLQRRGFKSLSSTPAVRTPRAASRGRSAPGRSGPRRARVRGRRGAARGSPRKESAPPCGQTRTT